MAQQPTQDIAFDATQLYQEESFTDRQTGSVQRLTPLTADGQPDASRKVLYVGQTQVMTPAGALPLSFELHAESLEEAMNRFGAAAQEALNNTLKRLEEMRREQASSLVVPGSGGGQMPGGMGGGGIKMP